jgi:hypothetical protein
MATEPVAKASRRPCLTADGRHACLQRRSLVFAEGQRKRGASAQGGRRLTPQLLDAVHSDHRWRDRAKMTMEAWETRIEVESVGVNDSTARALRAPTGNNGAYADRVPKAAEGGITSDVFGSVPSNHCYCRANPVSALVSERTEEPLKPRMLAGNFAKAIILAVYKRSVRRLDGFIKSDVGQRPVGRPAGC